MSSLIEQVNHLFAGNRGTGESRHAWKVDNPGFGRMAPKTFAWTSEKRYKSAAVHAVTWMREQHHIRQIAQLTPAMVTAYVAARLAEGKSPRTVSTDVTALRRLGLYAVKEGWCTTNFVPDNLSVPHGSQPRYSYAPDEERVIIAHVAAIDPLASDVLLAMGNAGFRLKEAILVRRDFINFETGAIEVKGKGKKIRTVVMTDRVLLERLAGRGRWPLLRGLADSWKRRVEALVRQACLANGIKPNGTHAFRAAAAQRLYDDQINAGQSDRAARRVVAKRLGHTRCSVTRSYAP